MKVRHLHPWDLTFPEAAELQRRLAEQLEFPPLRGSVRTLAGADLSFSRRDPVLHAGIVVLALPGLEPIESVFTSMRVEFPYVPGYLSFREIPPLVGLFERLETTPDAVLCDGQGIAHPRGLGLAAHLGLLLDLPTVGCAKTRFVGEYAPPGPEKGDWSPLTLEGRVVGAALRTRTGVKPVFVSPGHKVDLEGALRLVQLATTRFRLPETTRQSHQLVNRVRRGEVRGSAEAPG